MKQTIASFLQHQATRKADQVAMTTPGRLDLSYRRLWQQMEYVVKWLNAMRLGRNDRVAIVLPNGPEMATTFVAVAAGATAAPLNPNYRQSEFEFYLSDLKARAVIVLSGTESPVKVVADARSIPVIELSLDSEAEAGTFTLAAEQARLSDGEHSGLFQTGFAEEDDVALVLHTSGTTSRPKIVPLTQRNLCNSTANHTAALELTEQDICLNMMPLFHIHGLISAVLSSLTSGASVICTPGFDAPRFFEWVKTFCPTWFTAAPALYHALLEYASNNREVLGAHSLRFLRSAAAPMPKRILKEVEQLFNVPVIESYGMTEAAAQITSNPLPPRKRKPGSVGRASGPQVAIMDEQGNILGPEKVGEIVIRGASVMAGYENNTVANASAFANGWFHTGDQGFMDQDGYLFITGRIKDIINRGGEKIAPREIDEVLSDHPGVADVVTFAIPHARLGQDIVAAVVLRENASACERELRDFVSAQLSQHKVPSRVLIVEEIPKGSTGKVQRGRLAEELETKLKGQYSPARNPIEKTTAQIWAEVLGVTQVGSHDNFFTLGGDSLSATRVVARLQSAFQLDLPVRVLFDYPTVAELSQMISERT
jgi:acyl-CoA synthetase (AMP-forming)/AMP-acid ligase II/acyl carrier protein